MIRMHSQETGKKSGSDFGFLSPKFGRTGTAQPLTSQRGFNFGQTGPLKTSLTASQEGAIQVKKYRGAAVFSGNRNHRESQTGQNLPKTAATAGTGGQGFPGQQQANFVTI